VLYVHQIFLPSGYSKYRYANSRPLGPPYGGPALN
jgi:hypothetical protein